MSVNIGVLVRGGGNLQEVTTAVEQLLPVQFRLEDEDSDPCFRSRGTLLNTFFVVYRADLEDVGDLILESYDWSVSLYARRTVLSLDESVALRELIAIYLARELTERLGWECLVMRDMHVAIPY